MHNIDAVCAHAGACGQYCAFNNDGIVCSIMMVLCVQHTLAASYTYTSKQQGRSVLHAKVAAKVHVVHMHMRPLACKSGCILLHSQYLFHSPGAPRHAAHLVCVRARLGDARNLIKDGREQVGGVVGHLALHDAGHALQTHACVDVLCRQQPQAAVFLAIVLQDRSCRGREE